MATIMGIVADRHGWDITGTTMTVDKEMTAELPRRIARLTVRCQGPGHLDEAATRALEAAANSCPVKLSLLPAIEIPVEFRWGA